jgi:outer membrane receptor protein involved in Fe transport
MQIHALLLSFLTVLAFALAPTLGFAQDVQDNSGGASAGADVDDGDIEDVYVDDPDIEVIVVRGGEADGASDFETGDSVAAFDASDLDALGAQSIADLASFTPNLEIVTSGATTPTFFIRGVGLNDFNANSTSAVAIIFNDVPKNAPALQLGTLFDIEGVNVLRGPQGSGNYRAASAGAIKIYTKKPTGNYNGNMKISYGNYNAIDMDGAVGGPVFEDILAARLAFRFSDRDGYGKNGCGNATPRALRGIRPAGPDLFKNTDKRISQCGEFVKKEGAISNLTFLPADGRSDIPDGLPTRINNQHNWAARGTLLFQPTLDQEWLFTASGGSRDELTRLGQTYGTAKEANSTLGPQGFGGRGVLGSEDQQNIGGAYVPDEVVKRRYELDPCIDNNSGIRTPTANRNICFLRNSMGQLINSSGMVVTDEADAAADGDKLDYTDFVARQLLATELARNLDSKPYRGDYNRIGSTELETWGLSLKGDIVLSDTIHITTVTGYDHYDRFLDNDLDATPNVRFEFITTDNGWQFSQTVDVEGDVSEDIPIKWVFGGLFLYEELNVAVEGIFDDIAAQAAVSLREYQQTLWSGGFHAGFTFDFWEKFALDAGLRYNWERKSMEYLLIQADTLNALLGLEVWQAPTGSVRLTYNFKETTYAYWKYTRGWKGGHFNATGSEDGITNANPENVDSFEIGVHGSWFDGKFGVDGSLFHYNYENYQLFTSETRFRSNPEFVVLNASNAEVYGAELDLNFRPLDGMFLRISMSWLESQFLDYTQIQVSARPLSFSGTVIQNNEIQNSGNPLLNSPQFKVSMTAQQDVPLGKLGTLTARWDGAWTAATNYDATNGRGIPNFEGEQFLPKYTIGQRSYWIHNIRLAYRTPSGGVEIAAWVRNVENFVYKNYAVDATIFNQTTIFFVGQPRTFGLSLSTSF